jgi:hypothetical protein
MSPAVLRVILAGLALSTMTALGTAQAAEVSGTVQRVDAATRTVYFSDGRVVTLEPGARLYVGEREVPLSDIQPGWVLVTSEPPAVPIVTQPSAALATAVPSPPALAAPTAATVNATGVVRQVDAQNGTVTLQDGRVLHVSPGTTLWQPVTLGSVVPGTAVFVRNAEPLDFQPATARAVQMGTISTVDASRSQVVLSDGTVVQLRPGAQATFNGQPLPLTGLRAGDEIVVDLPPTATVSVTPLGAPVSALPRGALGVIEADSIYVVRRAQAP